MQRLVPDPSIGVSDLMDPLTQWLKDNGTRNILHLLGKPVGLTWKTTPNASWMSKMKPLMEELVKITPHLGFASKKLRGALVKMNAKDKMNFTKKDDDDFSILLMIQLDWLANNIEI